MTFVFAKVALIGILGQRLQGLLQDCSAQLIIRVFPTDTMHLLRSFPHCAPHICATRPTKKALIWLQVAPPGRPRCFRSRYLKPLMSPRLFILPLVPVGLPTDNKARKSVENLHNCLGKAFGEVIRSEWDLVSYLLSYNVRKGRRLAPGTV